MPDNMYFSVTYTILCNTVHGFMFSNYDTNQYNHTQLKCCVQLCRHFISFHEYQIFTFYFFFSRNTSIKDFKITFGYSYVRPLMWDLLFHSGKEIKSFQLQIDIRYLSIKKWHGCFPARIQNITLCKILVGMQFSFIV